MNLYEHAGVSGPMYREMLLILFNLFPITKLMKMCIFNHLAPQNIHYLICINLYKKLNAKLPNTRGRYRISRGHQPQRAT